MSQIVPDLSVPLAPLGEVKEGYDFETDASSNSQCSILVESQDTFSGEHSLNEPTYVDFRKVSPHIELIDPLSDESSSNLDPPLPFHLFLLPSPFFLLL